MRKFFDFMITYYLIGVVLVIMLLTFFFARNNETGIRNQAKRAGKKAYLAHEYKNAYRIYSHLRDSLHVSDEALIVNQASAAFLTSNLPDTSRTDTVNYRLSSLQNYDLLLSAGDEVVASMAANQLGFAVVKARDAMKMKPSAIDSLLRRSLGYFRLALEKDPGNEAARYNYELVKKLIEYPELVVRMTRKLVDERRYKEASELLQGVMRRDKRLESQKEFLERIKIVAAIDSMKNIQ